ncbi:MAG: PQQ-like beta-propeller repeat protein [Pirellulales bacterium]|nr:PQQ-like beta-propeller repeat protein [Pirellulales bacterium]
MSEDLLWTAPLPSDGVGGLMVDGETVVVTGRDAADQNDRLTALDLSTGQVSWIDEYPAPAKLDYGNSPRGTPAAAGGVIVALGATGVLSALDGQTGVALWRVDLQKRFKVSLPTWGFSGSPLVLNDQVFVQVGKDSALAAIDLYSGETLWQVPGRAAAYSSLMPARGGKWIIGSDQVGYFARRAVDGSLVWSYEPEIEGDFGVPSPVIGKDHLIFTSENNGVQLIPIVAGRPQSGPAALVDSLIPDSHTPVAVQGRLLVAYDGLHALDLNNNLEELWSVAGDHIRGYASVIASGRHALVTTEDANLLLVRIDGSQGKLVDQRRLSNQNLAVLSHPAIAADRLLVRVGREVRCYRLKR